MALRPDILLSGRVANPARAMAAGAQAAGRMDETRKGIQMNRMMQEMGPGIMAGDPQALNALARFDPGAALTIKRQHAAERRAQAAAGRAAAAAKRAAAAAAQDEASAAELAREVDLLRKVALTRENGEEAFVQALNTSGLAQEGVTPANFDMYLATGEGAIAELGKAVQSSRPEPVEPDYRFSDGQYYDANNPQAGATPIPNFVDGGPETVVNVNNAPPMPGLSKLGEGYTYLYNEDGTVRLDENGLPMSAPVPGSKAAQAAQEATAEQAASQTASEMQSADYDRKFGIVDDNITKAIGMIDRYGRLAAGVGSLTSNLPETPARELQATIDTVKANLGFEELQAMREASPTGGALGQVTEREIAFLQAIQGNLDAAQSPDELKSILTDIQTRRRQFREERQRIMNTPSESGVDLNYQSMNLDQLLKNVPTTEKAAAAWNRRFDELQ